MDDKEIIKLIAQGDTSAFSLLLNRFKRPVFSLLAGIVHNREEAEELTQDVFMKVYKNAAKFRSDCSISTWIYRITYNTAISATRKSKYDFSDLDEKIINNIPDDVVDDVLDRSEDEELMIKLESAVKQLDADANALISLYYNQDKSIKEIADIMQLSAENVKVRLFRIRKRLVYLTNQM